MEEKKVIIIEVPAIPTSPVTAMDGKEEKTAAGGFFPLLSVEEIFKWARLPLPVTKKSRFPRTMLLSVEVVLGWALLGALAVALALGVSAVMLFANIPIPCRDSQSSKFFQCPDLTPAQDAETVFFLEGYLLFTVPEAVAATAGLLLPRGHARVRWSLAFLAIVSTTFAHYMNARSVLIFIAANPGDIGYRILVGGFSVVYLVVDLLGVLSLVIGGAEAE
ncbi:hypothetical protein QOZ80_6BG0458260 [Eleusine coracana subsp. coracana]|nr:hypothetical protein QOZ80_6BG0458260 [Eleusine coracana subsp. coracana]